MEYGWNLTCCSESLRGYPEDATGYIVNFGSDSNSWSQSGWIAPLAESDLAAVASLRRRVAAVWWHCHREWTYC